MRHFLWISLAGLCLLSLVYPIHAQTSSWNPYDRSRVDGTVILDSKPEGPIPASCQPPATKSRYVIGMSQANRAEPWREMMDKQIAEAAQDYPQLAVIFADARQDNAKQVADVQNFLALNIDLLIISPNEAEPLTDVIR